MVKKKNRFRKILLYGVLSMSLLIILGITFFYFRTKIDPPAGADESILSKNVTKVDSTFFTLGKNWIRKNEGGLWEMYVEGDAFERGVVIGKLAQPLIRKQEDAFIAQIKKIVPSESYLNFLKYFIAWFNRDIDKYIPEEYKLEIYGESFAASHEYDFIGDPYHRMLNYHAAHDIGHALQDKNMVVGCTAFSAWGKRTTDGSLLIGRNFDFYVGDEFAEDKMLIFFNPDKGNKFMIVSWGGMIGAVSGMNAAGLTVTMNAGKSEIPTGAATPISILGREILQYATNIEEAYEIAKKRKTFVAEALMIGSAKDGKTAIIEKSPEKIGIVYPENDEIVCTNHFRSETFKNQEINLKNIKESASLYRYERMEELLNQHPKFDYTSMAEILRDQKGQNGSNIGMGNELAVNQLLAHHSIIFKPEQNLVWISSNPFQLGEYFAYDLNDFFSKASNSSNPKPTFVDSLNIPADPFLTTDSFKNFLRFKEIKNKLTAYLSGNPTPLTEEEITNFEHSNPEYYYMYSLLGDYHKKTGQMKKAKQYYEKGLTKVIATKKEREHMEGQIKQLEEK